MNWLKHLCRKTPASREAELLTDARMALVEHEAAAEHHDALATLYRHRVERLENSLSLDTRPVVVAQALPGAKGWNP